MSKALPEGRTPARSCGSCTMCCKVYEVPPIDNKPRGVWCKHCKPGSGCGIWESRPDFCRDFHCEWIRDLGLGDEWRPDKARFVMNFREALGIMTVMVDPGSPNAWRREPYHSVLRSMAQNMAQKQFIIQVVTLRSGIVLGAERDFPVIEPDQPLKLRWQTRATPTGTHYELIGVVTAEMAGAA